MPFSPWPRSKFAELDIISKLGFQQRYGIKTLNSNFKIFKSDSRDVRRLKKRGRKNLKRRRLKENLVYRSVKKVSEESVYDSSKVHFDVDIENFCEINNIKTWKDNRTIIKLDEEFCLFENPSRVLKSLLGILHNAKRINHYSKLVYKGNISFGALYLIDSMCWEIAKSRRWRLDYNGVPKEEAEVLSRLRSIESGTLATSHSVMINEKVRIQRDPLKQEQQDYRRKIKVIFDRVQEELSQGGQVEDLSPDTYHAINSTIGEHFDNIYLHAPNAQFGTLCGFFDKKNREVTILIFNFGETIDHNLSKSNIPAPIKDEIDQIISNHMKKEFFRRSPFTKENAITLAAIQEGISSRIEHDKSRGHGLIDFIENCFKLSDETKISIVSGNTAIKIDKTYGISPRNIFGRTRRILALNSENDLFEKPDDNFVKNLSVHFPGVIIETRIPIPL